MSPIASVTVRLGNPMTGRAIADVVRKIAENHLARPAGASHYDVEYLEMAYYNDGPAVKVGQARALSREGDFCAAQQVQVRSHEDDILLCDRLYAEVLVVNCMWRSPNSKQPELTNQKIIAAVRRFAAVLDRELNAGFDDDAKHED